MKRLLIALCFAAGLAFAGSINYTVTSATKVLPDCGATSATLWSNAGIYAQGQYAQVGQDVWMVVVAGTSGTAVSSSPIAGQGGIFTDTNGVLRFYRVPRERTAMTLQTLVGTNVTWSMGFSSGINTGTVVEPRGTLSLPIGGEKCWQGEVFANSTGATVNVQEW